MIGRSVASASDWCTRTALAGMEVGSHSWSHAQLDKKRGAGLDEQLTRASEEIARCTGRPPLLLRAPYGARNRRSDNAAGRLGESDVLWDVDTEDWKTLDTDANFAAVHRDAHRGAIILMHEIHPTSVAAVPAILQDLQAQWATACSPAPSWRRAPWRRGATGATGDGTVPGTLTDAIDRSARGRLPHDELSRKDHSRSPTTVDQIEQKTHHLLTDPIERLSHRRDRRP